MINEPILKDLCNFHHISLTVNNLAISIKFYQEIFGFTEITKLERKDLKGNVIFMKLNDMILELWQFDNQKENRDNMSDLNVVGFKHLAFRTDSIENVHKNLKAVNIELSDYIKGATGIYFFMKDPSGFPIEIIELYENPIN